MTGQKNPGRSIGRERGGETRRVVVVQIHQVGGHQAQFVFQRVLMRVLRAQLAHAFVQAAGGLLDALDGFGAPGEVAAMISELRQIQMQAVFEHNGVVDKFIGDAIMAVFRGDYHLDRAIDACLAVRKRIDEQPAIDAIGYKPKVSIGINSGEMISGNIGSANLKRLDYTVIGDSVKTAQRLQVAAQPGQIIINEKSYEQVKESFNL